MLSALAVTAIAATGLASMSRWQNLVEAKGDQFSIVPFANELGEQFSPAASPDGTKVASVWDGNRRNYDIFIRT